jgi:hypothetical protein
MQAQGRVEPLRVSPCDVHDRGCGELAFHPQRLDVRDLLRFDDTYGAATDDVGRGGEGGGELARVLRLTVRDPRPGG